MALIRPSLALFLAGCAAEPSTVTTTSELACGQWVCGENGPNLGGLVPFDEMHPVEENQNHLRIVSFTKVDGTAMTVSVEGAELFGVVGSNKLSGPDLHDSVLRIENTLNLLEYDVTIETTGFAQYYEDGESPAGAGVPTYLFTYRQVGLADSHHVCPLLTAQDWGAQNHHAVIFGGDRYDKTLGVVSAIGAEAGDWFNIGCVGDVKSKVLLMRHAEAAQTAGFLTTKAQRTAAVRMLRADYCGTGEPYTIDGVDLDWENHGGWNRLDQPPKTAITVEAIWTENGALCLTQPRYVSPADLAADNCIRLPCTQPQIALWRSKNRDWISVIP